MKNVCILIPEMAVMAAVTDPQYMFTAVNKFLEAEEKEPLFNVQLVSVKKETFLNHGSFSVHADALMKDVKKS